MKENKKKNALDRHLPIDGFLMDEWRMDGWMNGTVLPANQTTYACANPDIHLAIDVNDLPIQEHSHSLSIFLSTYVTIYRPIYLSIYSSS